MRSYAFVKPACWKNAQKINPLDLAGYYSFSGRRKAWLVSRMQRAALPVASDLAEDSSGISSKDHSRLNNLAYSSSMKLMNQLVISVDLNCLSTELLSEGKPNCMTAQIKTIRSTYKHS